MPLRFIRWHQNYNSEFLSTRRSDVGKTVEASVIALEKNFALCDITRRNSVNVREKTSLSLTQCSSTNFAALGLGFCLLCARLVFSNKLAGGD